MEKLIKVLFVSALMVNTGRLSPPLIYNSKEPLPCCAVSSTLKCYNCGYRIVNGGEAEPLPEGDLSYCSDFATPTDIVKNCTAPSDCCASMKEEMIK